MAKKKNKAKPVTRKSAKKETSAAKHTRAAVESQITESAEVHPDNGDELVGQSSKELQADLEASEAPAPGLAVPAFTIVGVGASAGGLESFSQLLRAIPKNARMAIVYIQHLSPLYESSLAALLAANTPMPVTQISDRMPIEAGQVYVIPPNAFLSINSGLLRLSPRPEGRSQRAPVDYFFRSLAAYAQQHAVGVVLSGTDSDGSSGLREIKSVGGITIAQEPATAKFDGMPRSAISTGAVDAVLPPAGIALELARLAHYPFLRHAKARTSDNEVAISNEHWQRVFALLRNSSGVDFTHYKQPTLRRRLQRRMVLHKSSGVEHYLRYLQQTPSEVTALYQDILIHVTRFFREPDSYDFLISKVFPQIVRDRRSGDQPIRVWVPGCATGEEAYSVAICLLEFLGDDATATPVQVFATDVSESAVGQARAGIYPESVAGDVSPERLRRFFNKVDGSFRISKSVRDIVIFARQDLTRDPPFSKLDVVICRNVLIYLGPILQKKLMSVFHYALKPTGFLILGSSESIGPHSDLFALADKKFKVYTKKITGVGMNMDFHTGNYAQQNPDALPKEIADTRTGPSILNEANRIVLGRYAPPGVVVDENLQIIQFRGQTGPYLEPAPGEASLNLLKMAREGLLYDLRAALTDARKTGSPARRENLRIQHDGHTLSVNIEILPIIVTNDHRHFLIMFEDASHAGGDGDGKAKTSKKSRNAAGKTLRRQSTGRVASDEDKSKERLLRLQQEVAASREYLQSIIQDLEAANEELQSANEEILSSNEELQSTNEELDTAKEELQSTNEELNTVNEELQARNEELSRANSDLMNLLSSVQIAVVMVTSDLRIRRFTPMAEKVLNLIPTDIGRPIGDIKPNFDLPDLEKLITEAVDTVNSIEREVRDRQGVGYLLRIRPYKNIDNRIDGAVLALFDMEMGGRPDRAELDAQMTLEGLLAVTDEPIVLLDGQSGVLATNEAFLRTFNVKWDQTQRASIYELSEGQWDIPQLHELLERVLPNEGSVHHFRIDHAFNGLGQVRLDFNARRVRRDDDDFVVLSINLIERP